MSVVDRNGFYSAIQYNCPTFLDSEKYDGTGLSKISLKYVVARQKTGTLVWVLEPRKYFWTIFLTWFFILLLN